MLGRARGPEPRPDGEGARRLHRLLATSAFLCTSLLGSDTGADPAEIEASPPARVVRYFPSGTPSQGDHLHRCYRYWLWRMLVVRDAAFDFIDSHVWKNPLNYVGLIVTGAIELTLRGLFVIYGEIVTILTKRIGATCRKLD